MIPRGYLGSKGLVDKLQKASMYGWLVGSLCTLLGEVKGLAKACNKSRADEADKV